MTKSSLWRNAVRPHPRVARSYVGGRTLNEAEPVIRRLIDRGAVVSVDRVGARISEELMAHGVADEYLQIIGRFADEPNQVVVSAHLNNLGLDISPELCTKLVHRILSVVPKGWLLQVGAEDPGRTDAVLAVVRALRAEGAPVMATIQANLRRSPADVSTLT